MLHSSGFPFTESVYYIATTFDNTVGYIRQILIFRRHFTLQMQQEGENMILRFNDATELQIQSAELIGTLLQIKTISSTEEELRKKFEDKLACKKMEVIEREQVKMVYENHTELLRIEKYTGEILGVAMCREGESPEERLASVEQDQKELKEAREQDAKQLTDLQLAVCEIYEMKTGV